MKQNINIVDRVLESENVPIVIWQILLKDHIAFVCGVKVYNATCIRLSKVKNNKKHESKIYNLIHKYGTWT